MKAKFFRKQKHSITVDGVEYAFRFDLNALALLEEQYGNVDDAFTDLQKGSVSAVRNFLWAGINSVQEEYLTVQQVGSLIDMKTIPEVTSKVVEAFLESLPEENKNTP